MNRFDTRAITILRAFSDIMNNNLYYYKFRHGFKYFNKIEGGLCHPFFNMFHGASLIKDEHNGVFIKIWGNQSDYSFLIPTSNNDVADNKLVYYEFIDPDVNINRKRNGAFEREYI